MVSFWGQKKPGPRPDWYPLGGWFKISNEHLYPLYCNFWLSLHLITEWIIGEENVAFIPGRSKKRFPYSVFKWQCFSMSCNTLWLVNTLSRQISMNYPRSGEIISLSLISILYFATTLGGNLRKSCCCILRTSLRISTPWCSRCHKHRKLNKNNRLVHALRISCFFKPLTA